MEKLSQAGITKNSGPKTTRSLSDSGHVEMSVQAPYRADQCVQQTLCRLTGIYEPRTPKMASMPIPQKRAGGQRR